MADTVPTPLTRAKGVVIRSSMIFSKAGKLSLAVTLISMIGMSSALNLKITGLVAPSGK